MKTIANNINFHMFDKDEVNLCNEAFQSNLASLGSAKDPQRQRVIKKCPNMTLGDKWVVLPTASLSKRAMLVD